MADRPEGCVGFLIRLFGGRGEIGRAGQERLPAVMVNKYFVTEAEAGFFRVLRQVVGDRGHVLAQVSLQRLLYLPGNAKSNPGRGTWRNKIAARSVDFVVCDLAMLRPRVVIELDEPSHARPERQTRDEEVEAILDKAGLPVVHVLTSRTYDTRELAATILPHLSRADGAANRGRNG